jgi:hypothetical protein
MKNLKKLSRGQLKNIFGGGDDLALTSADSGGCEAGHFCACGAIYNNFGPRTPTWDCCACPPKVF